MRENQITITQFDFDMIHRRSEILMRMAISGMITSEEFCEAFESQKKPSVLKEEQDARVSENFEDSPYQRLLSQYIRRGGKFNEQEH